MAGETGGAAVTLQPCEEQALRRHIESAAAGKKNLTTEQLVDLLCSAFPQFYSCRNRKLLIERVAKITPLPFSIDDADDEPTTFARKRLKLDENRSVSRQNKVSSLSVSVYNSSQNDGSSDFGGDLGASDGLGHGRRETNKEGGLNDVRGDKRPMFRDLLGMESAIRQIKMAAMMPLHQLKLLRHLGVESIPPILLHGPPGFDKTTLARAVGNESGFPFYEISAVELVSGVSGAPEVNIRDLFSTAYMNAPSIVFIDEIDALASKTESSQKKIKPCIVNQLIACMDEPYRLIKPMNDDAASESCTSRPGYVLVIGATNRFHDLDPVLRRRFDDLIRIDADCDRSEILSTLTRNLKVNGVDFAKLARCTLGFVAGDLVKLVKKACMLPVKKIMYERRIDTLHEQMDGVQSEEYYRKPFSNEEMKNLSITMADFMEAGKMVQPSSDIEKFSTTPKAKWEDVGGLESLKLDFERYIVQRIKFPEVYKDLGVYLDFTFLLVGPSGCGKTLIVEALANEAGVKFIHVKGRELATLCGYGDEGGLVVGILFNYARTCSPCILFFDELIRQLDFLRLQLHFEKKGCDIYVIAATDKSDLLMHMDEGMFDKVLHVPLPTPDERGAILKALGRNKPIDANVDLMALGKDIACKNFNGADLSALMKKAVEAAIARPTSPGEDCRVPWTIKDVDFKNALRKISPSVPRMQV